MKLHSLLKFLTMMYHSITHHFLQKSVESDILIISIRTDSIF